MERGNGNGKPRVHNRDHEHGGPDVIQIHYEDVGGAGSGGGGSGIMFDTSPQTGGFLEATATTGSINLETTGSGSGSQDINIQSDNENVNLVAGYGINIIANGSGGIILETHGSGDLLLQLGTGTNLIITGLPTSPGGTGQVWNNSGVLSIA